MPKIPENESKMMKNRFWEASWAVLKRLAGLLEAYQGTLIEVGSSRTARYRAKADGWCLLVAPDRGTRNGVHELPGKPPTDFSKNTHMYPLSADLLACEKRLYAAKIAGA